MEQERTVLALHFKKILYPGLFLNLVLKEFFAP